MGARIGSEASKDLNKKVSSEWRELPPQERARFGQKALEMTQARENLKRCPLNWNCVQADEVAVADNQLTSAQQKRLNTVRLDPTLAQVTEHKAWSAGFGIADHFCALKACHVRTDLTDDDIKEKFTALFGYDTHASQNPAPMSVFQRSCVVQNGGVCAAASDFKFISKLVDQFDSVFTAHKLGGDPFMVHFSYNVRRWVSCDAAAAAMNQPSISEWVLVGCVAKRPKSQVLLRLYQSSESTFSFRVKDGLPDLLTSHQLFAKLFRQHVEGYKQPPCHFGLEVACLSKAMDISSESN